MTPVSLFATLALALSASQAPAPQLDARDLERARDHYARVGEELERRDVSGLDTARRARRARLIEALALYAERGDFGRRPDGDLARIPLFVDDGGRRCAVANLLHETGDDSLVAAVRGLDNEAWVVDLAGDGAFLSWLDRHGLSLREAARIQLPTGIGGPPPGDTGAAGAAGGRAPAGPASGRAPASNAPDRGPAGAGRPASSGGGGGGRAPSSPAAMAGAQPSSSLGDSGNGWWLWWEFNKLQHLRPNVLDARAFPLSGDSPGDALAARMRQLRGGIEPLLIAGCEHRDAGVRAAAVVSLGRTAGARSVPHLVARLQDRSQLVRHRAILALGASGAPEAQVVLEKLAREGTHRDGISVSRVARPLALVALGLGRRVGFDEGVDELVLEVLGARGKAERSSLGLAVAIYHTLAPGMTLEGTMASMAFSKEEPAEVRSRALESLRSSTDPEVLSGLQDALHGPQLEARRSAALALGGFQHPLVAPALMTGFETEAEPFARGFHLVSLGQQGGEEVLEFLVDVLRDGKHVTRPWAALALGTLARHDTDATAQATEALRARLAKEKNRDTRAALWLGLGLARDQASIETLATAMGGGADPRHRMYAATALSLVGGEEARTALLARLDDETSQLVRAGIAQGLGVLGDRRDVPTLYRTMREVSDPDLRGLAITALAFHGSESAFTALRELSEATSTPSAALANAIDALGVMTSVPGPFAMAEVSQAANFTLFSDWVTGLFQATL